MRFIKIITHTTQPPPTAAYPEEDGVDFEEVKRLMELTQSVWAVFPLVLVGVGTLGNALSILVLTRPDMGASSMALYLIVLAFSDTACLYLGVFNYWLVKVQGVELTSSSAALCRIYPWLVHTSLDLSSWLLVAVTAERVVCVWLPYQAKVRFTRRRSAGIVLVILLCIMAVNAHLIGGMGLHHVRGASANGSESQLVCGPVDPPYKAFVEDVWPWVDLCVFSLGPTALLVVGSFLIILKVTKSARKRSSLSGGSLSIGQFESRAMERRRLSSLTAVLLSLILVFAFSTSPVCVFIILQKYFIDVRDPISIMKGELAWAIVSNVMYLANALNFFMFIICGSRLRRIFCDLFNRTRPTRTPIIYTVSGRPLTVTRNTSIQEEEEEEGGEEEASLACCCFSSGSRHPARESASRQASNYSAQMRAGCPGIFHLSGPDLGTVDDSASSSGGGFSSRGVMVSGLPRDDDVSFDSPPQARATTPRKTSSVSARVRFTAVIEVFNEGYVADPYDVSPVMTAGGGVDEVNGAGGTLRLEDGHLGDEDVDGQPASTTEGLPEQRTVGHLATSAVEMGLVAVRRTHL